MTRIPIIAFALTLVAACDSEEAATQAPMDELAQADTEAPAESNRDDGPRWKRRGERHRNPAEHLCADLGCTDDQKTQIEAVFDHSRPERGNRPDRREADAALAQAFRSDGFSVTDIETHHQSTKSGRARGSEHLETMAEVHAILNAKQRNALAEKIETDGLRGKGRRHHGRRGGDSRDPERMIQHVERRVERMCRELSCTEEQVASLTAIVAQAKADMPPRQGKEDNRKAIAEAMRSASFDADDLRVRLDVDETRQEHRTFKAEVLVAIHGVLDAEQRRLVAAKIEEYGPRALMGKPGRRGNKGRRHRGRR